VKTPHLPRRGHLFTTLALLSSLATPVTADDLIWDGSTGNWDTDASWLPGGIEPTGNDNVTIDSGQVTIDLLGEHTRTLYLGDVGSASLTIEAGGTLDSNLTYLGYQAGASGSATVTGPGSLWETLNGIAVGEAGTGSLTIEAGGAVINHAGTLGVQTGAVGTALVTGLGSSWTNSNLYVGDDGAGALTIESGGAVGVSGSTWVGRGATGSGSIHFDGGTLTTADLFAGPSDLVGTGTITTGGLVSDLDLVFDAANGLQQTRTLDALPGQAVTLNIDVSHEDASSLGAGYRRVGALTIADGRSIQISGDGYLGYHAGSSGTATVSGAGSAWTSTGNFYAGYYGSGTLLVENGAVVSNRSGYLGSRSGSSGTAIVAGAGSAWNSSGDLYSGYYGTGVLTIADGGAVHVAGRTWLERFSDSGRIQFDDGTLTTGDLIAPASQLLGTGTINTEGVLSDVDLLFDATHGLQQTLTLDDLAGQGITLNLDVSEGKATILGVGYRDAGTLMIADGRVVSVEGTNSFDYHSGAGFLGYHEGAAGNATVTGAASAWHNSGKLFVGFSGEGSLTIADGGTVSNTTGYLADNPGSTGTALVTGAGSTWNNSIDLYVGDNGTGTLTIADGGTVNVTQSTWVGRGTTEGTLHFDGGTLNTGVLYAAAEDLTGTGTINAGGLVTDIDLVIDTPQGLAATLVFDALPDQNITLNFDTPTNDPSTLGIGLRGDSTLMIASGGVLTNGTGILAEGWGSTATAVVTGAGSTWTNTGPLRVAVYGDATLTIDDGGAVTSAGARLGDLSDVTGTVSVTGAGSTWATTGLVQMGYWGTGALSIADGGTVTNNTGVLGYYDGAVGNVSVTGVGSVLHYTGDLTLGRFGLGTLTVTDGAVASNQTATLGLFQGASGTATVIGVGSTWTISEDLYVGDEGAGSLTIADGGVVDVAGATLVGWEPTASGAIFFDGGTLNTAALFAGSNQLLGVGTINTDALVSDIDLVIDALSSPQQTLVFNDLPGQNVTLNLNASAGELPLLGLGYTGTGSLRIADGQSITSTDSYLGYKRGSSGTATVTGAGSTWTTTDKFVIGESGAGELIIENGGVVHSNASTTLANEWGSNGSVVVRGSGSTWNSQSIDIGQDGAGALLIEEGAAVVSGSSVDIATFDNSTGSVIVTGTGSTLTILRDLTVADRASAH